MSILRVKYGPGEISCYSRTVIITLPGCDVGYVLYQMVFDFLGELPNLSRLQLLSNLMDRSREIQFDLALRSRVFRKVHTVLTTFRSCKLLLCCPFAKRITICDPDMVALDPERWNALCEVLVDENSSLRFPVKKLEISLLDIHKKVERSDPETLLDFLKAINDFSKQSLL